MKYIPLPVTRRVLDIKEDYLHSQVALEGNMVDNMKKEHRVYVGDRWLTLPFLEGWLKHEDAPTTFRRRALSEAEELYGWEPIITEHELLAGQPSLYEYSPAEKKRYDELYEMFRMSSVTTLGKTPVSNHLSLDLDKLLRVGITGLVQEIKTRRDALDLNDRTVYPCFEILEQYDLYESMLIELEALADLERRYAEKAHRMAKSATGARQKELLRMAKALEKVPAGPAQSFYEALQSIHFFLGTLFGLYPLNRPDRYLLSFYEKDIKEGSLTREEAQELIDNFCLGISNRVYSRAACGFILGGEDADGNIVENDLTYLFLTALDHIRMPDPNGALAVSEKTSDDILKYAAEILSRGVTHPAFYNDRAIVEALIRRGVAREDAVNYIHTTCAEISVIGKSRAHTTPFSVPLPQMLYDVVKRSDNNTDFEALKREFIETVYRDLCRQSLRYLMSMLEAKKNAHEPIRVNCLVDDCLLRGKSIWEGGERYTFIHPILVGFATAVDSLIAIDHLVYRENRLTLAEFCRIVEENFEGNEPLRQYIINKLPHYGNDDDESNRLAAWLAGEFARALRERPMLAADNMTPGTFTYILHAWYGVKDRAGFDGRLAAASYSDGCCPVQGRDVNGPTATILSLTSWDQSDFLGGMVVNMKYHPAHLTKEYLDQFVTLLRTFVARGGMEMQVNVVDRATLLDAKAHPERHKNLLVRIGGYSDYFVRLDECMQNEIIARSEH